MFINENDEESLLDNTSRAVNPMGAARLANVVDVMPLKRVVHSLGAVLFAFTGGFVGRILYSRDARTNL